MQQQRYGPRLPSPTVPGCDMTLCSPQDVAATPAAAAGRSEDAAAAGITPPSVAVGTNPGSRGVRPPAAPNAPRATAVAAAAATPEPDQTTQAAIRAVLEGLQMHGEDETDPPAGSLRIGTLRHQKLALNWMLKREGALPMAPGDASAQLPNPRGGILADDQGLGKTVTTISMIVSNRRPRRSRTPLGPRGRALVAAPCRESSNNLPPVPRLATGGPRAASNLAAEPSNNSGSVLVVDSDGPAAEPGPVGPVPAGASPGAGGSVSVGAGPGLISRSEETSEVG